MLIAFGSRLQSAVALNSVEAEYVTLAQIVKILLWIINIIEGIPGQFVRRPVPIHVDNKSAINLVDNHAASKFIRHIDITHHFLRDHCFGGDTTFKIIWVHIKKQWADGMIKSLPHGEFTIFRDRVVTNLRL